MFASFCACPIFADWVTPSARVENRVSVREEPVAGSSRIGYLAVGQRAELLDTLPYWYEVALPNGDVGYVSRSWTTIVAGDAMEPMSEAAQTTDFAVHVVDVGTTTESSSTSATKRS